jgi:sugar phosphate isomerase/epimerase
MKVALFTGIFRDEPFETAARAASLIGYNGVELRAQSHLLPDSTSEQVKEVKRIADRYGLAIPVVYTGVPGGYAKLSHSESMKRLDIVKKYAEWAAELGAEMVCHGPGGPAPGAAVEEDYDRTAEYLAAAAENMEQYKLKLVMEIHHGNLAETIDSVIKLLQRMKRTNAGAILDPGNMAIADEEYGQQGVQRLGHYLFHVHAKDVRFLQEALPDRRTPQYGRHMFVVDLMGNGHVDHSPAYGELTRSGYKGYVSLEAQVAGVSPEDTAKHEFTMFNRAMKQWDHSH